MSALKLFFQATGTKGCLKMSVGMERVFIIFQTVFKLFYFYLENNLLIHFPLCPVKGNIYEGNFVNDKMSGMGEYRFANGNS
jgi:hypothetical protein